MLIEEEQAVITSMLNTQNCSISAEEAGDEE
jgi:hypothetical protein